MRQVIIKKKQKKQMWNRTKTKINIIQVLFSITILSCQNNKKIDNMNELNFESFTLFAPQNWEIINVNSIDSNIGKISMGEGDTLFFDKSPYSNSLTEECDLRILPKSIRSQLPPDVDTSKIIFSDQPNIDIDNYRKQNIFFDTISDFLAKIIIPRKKGIGFTGIYFDSIGYYKTIGRMKFNLYGKDLKPKNQELLLKVLKTIKFKK